MNPFALRLYATLALVLAAASPAALAHDEDDDHEHHHHHGVVVQPRNFDHAVDLVRDGLEKLGTAVNKGDMHALHELSDGVVVPARAFGKLAAARPGAAPANIRAINMLGQDIATLVDAMHVAADSSKPEVVVAKWKQIEMLMPQLDALAPRPTVSINTDGTPDAGQRTTLKISMNDASGAPITAFEDHHGAAMHLVIVSNDLGFYTHEHPESQMDGVFLFDFTPPAGDSYTAFAVAHPQGRAEPLVLRAPLSATGTGRPTSAAPKPDTEPSKKIDGYLVRLKSPDHIHAGEPAAFTYMIDDAANPGGITTEEFLGGPAHFVGIGADTKHFVASTMVNRGGTGEIRVETTFPHEGLYGTWLEFKHSGKVVTVPFVIDVHEAD